MYSLKHTDIVIEGTANLLSHATYYYKKLFGHAPRNFLLFPYLWEYHEIVDVFGNEELIRKNS
jgi:hypothetical protein